MVKIYLGDAVYAEDQGDRIKLTTEDGIKASNTIFLEDSVMMSLHSFFKKARGVEEE